MTTVAEIREYLNTLAPEQTAESWDHVGLLLGAPQKEVSTILVALDPFENIAQEAVEIGADVLLTHHPLIFDPLNAITTDTALGRTIFTLIQNGISAINAHTNLDVAAHGVNQELARTLGLQSIRVLDPIGIDANGESYGLLRMGEVDEQPLPEFLAQVKQKLGCAGLRYCNGGRPVHRVAVGGGSCASELEIAARAGCDTFVTADVRYNRFRDAADLAIHLIDAGHFATEVPICAVLQQKLAEQFPNVRVLLSKKLKDVTNFF